MMTIAASIAVKINQLFLVAALTLKKQFGCALCIDSLNCNEPVPMQYIIDNLWQDENIENQVYRRLENAFCHLIDRKLDKYSMQTKSIPN